MNYLRVTPLKELGGCAIVAQWCSDFHHALSIVFTAEDVDYNMDFGNIVHLVKTVRGSLITRFDYYKPSHRH